MPLCTAAEVAAFLQKHKRTVIRYVEEDGLPAIILRETPTRRTLMFDLDAVRAWLATAPERRRRQTLDYSRHARRPAEVGQ